ncbi:MAG: hypothetical protein HFACDABA_00704 [Anaerolineales bacterium]|nr:hypothetical protein [Anaerolineales bacterium]
MNLEQTYETEILQHRSEREARLRDNERSWLALSGLFWLVEGNNTFGSSAANDIQLGSPAIPEQAGVFQYRNGSVNVRVNENVDLACNGETVKFRSLRFDIEENPDFLTIGSFIMVAIKRGKNCLVRVWDKETPARKQFTGLKHYPINSAYRITARFVPYDPARILKIRDVIGEEYDAEFPGFALFTIGGKECRLEAEKSGEDLFFNFYDPTNGNGSYPGGRFLDAEFLGEREVLLDFNKARNPPCAYTDYATCPLPPSQNRLPVRIPAGEMVYRQHHG